MKKISLLATFFLWVVNICKAQDDVAEMVNRMIQKYPDAVYRMEYRAEPDKDNQAFREIRYDFRIRRDAMQASDVRNLIEVCEKAWRAANSQTDRKMKYTHGDSICSTLVYNVKQPLHNLLQHDIPQTFWGNDGYLLFDLGEYVSVVVDKVEELSEMGRKPDFSTLNNAFEQLCLGRSVSTTPVRYTGYKGSFVFQRNKGRGWTRGVRHTVQGVDRSDYKQLCDAFMAYWKNGTVVNLIARNHTIMIKDESGSAVFIASLDESRTLRFLAANIENEICIPKAWETIDFFNNGQTNYVDVNRLDAVYDSLAARPGAVLSEVRYTGNGGEGFEWQRGSGSGWTEGKRIEIKNLTPDEQKHILDIFRSYLGVLAQINLTERKATTYEEGTRTFYGFTTEADGRSFFLKATTEGEICVPRGWTTKDYFKGSGPSAIEQASVTTKRMWGLSRLWAGVKQNFVFMDRTTTNWDSLYVSLIPRIMEAKDDYETVRLLQSMVAQLHDGHTVVTDAGGNMPTAPLRTKYIDGKVYINNVYSSLLMQQGVKRGVELIAIDGMPIEKYVKKFVEPYVASSTPQWLEHICYEEGALLQRKVNEELRLTLKEGERTFDVPYTVGSVQWDMSEKQPDFNFSILKDHIGYLRIASFNGSAIKGQFDSLYSDILRTRALVIDIRGNGGGNSGNSDYILRHFSADSMKTASWRSPMYIPAFASWGYTNLWHETQSGTLPPIQDKPVYDKPIVLLVDNATFSAAEDFCSIFRGMKRGLLVGQPTGGSTGNGVLLELIPGVAWANICSKHDKAVDGTEFVGKGFVPDVLVKETYESYFINKWDNGLTEAVRILSEQLKKR